MFEPMVATVKETCLLPWQPLAQQYSPLPSVYLTVLFLNPKSSCNLFSKLWRILIQLQFQVSCLGLCGYRSFLGENGWTFQEVCLVLITSRISEQFFWNAALWECSRDGLKNGKRPGLQITTVRMFWWASSPTTVRHGHTRRLRHTITHIFTYLFNSFF